MAGQFRFSASFSVAALAGLALLSAAAERFPKTPLQGEIGGGSVRPAKEKEAHGKRRRAAQGLPAQASAPEQELVFDDGTADGSGILNDGLIVVTRLTPRAYPVKLTKVKLLFVKFQNQPTPAGQQVRLLAFLDPEGAGRPPRSPRFVVDQRVTVPSTGEFAVFPVDGPVVESGDIYVGYQAPRPASGIGFAADTNGPARERGFSSKDDGASFSGPIEFNDGSPLNPLMRGVVRVSSESGPRSEELAIDDGTIETGLLRDGAMYVNRLTPTRYPAKLRKLRFYMPSFSNQPSPVGRGIRLVAFRDPSGAGQPPEHPALDVDRSVTIPATGDFMEFSVDDVLVESGDLYVGYQAPSPHEGVGFALDWDGPKGAGSFRSVNGGQTFSGPLEVNYEGTSGLANLMLRAVVDYKESRAAAFRLDADREGLDLSEAPESAVVQVVVGPAGAFEGEARLTARTEPAGVPVDIAVQPERVRAGVQAEITLSGLRQYDQDTFRVVVTAAAGEERATLDLPVFRWRAVAEETVGPAGKSFGDGEVLVNVPGGAFAGETRLRLLRGKPVTGLEEYHAGPVYQVEGIPDGFTGSIEVALPGTTKLASVRKAGIPPTVAAVMVPRSLPSGIVAGRPRMLPVAPGPAGTTAKVDAKRLKLEKKFTFWFVGGYYAAQTRSNRFLIYYPINFKEAAEAVGGMLEQAADLLESETVGIYFTSRASLPIDVTLKPLRDTLDGECDGEALWFNTLKLGTKDAIQAFRSAPGHELMHYVQALYGGNAPASARWYGTYPWYWMDDALSTWFEPVAMKQPGYIPTTVCPSCGAGTNISNNYLFAIRGLASPPGDKSDQEHGYGASMFLTSAQKDNDRLIARLVRDRNPASSAVAALSAVLGGPVELSKAWGMFATRYLTGDIYPGQKFPAPSDLAQSGANTIDAFAKADTHRFSWFGAPELSLNMFSVKVWNPAVIPDVTDEAVMAAVVEEGYDDVDLHALVYDRATSEYLGSVSGKRELLLPDARKLAAGRKTVLLGAVNRKATGTFDTRRDITVKVGLAAPAISIYPDFTRAKGVTRHEYEFTTRNRNIPSDAQYTWSLGGAVKQGRTVRHAFTNPGDYIIEVSTRVGSTDVRDRVTFTIAPDTEVKKVEVLFEVFRNLKTPVGSSKQMCNQYSIGIYNSQGAMVEGGDSIARNGAYTAIMQPGAGYEYRVQYVYTTPCADSGRATGKFDVRDGVIGNVRIETPPCEKN